MIEGTPNSEHYEEWAIEPGAIERIENKLDRLLSVLERFEPLLNKYAEFQNMSAADKVKAMINRGKS